MEKKMMNIEFKIVKYICGNSVWNITSEFIAGLVLYNMHNLIQ